MKKYISGLLTGILITLSITSYAAVKLIANYSTNTLAIDGKYINTKLVNVVDGKVSRNYVDINAIAKYIGTIKQNGKVINIIHPKPTPMPTPPPTLQDVVLKVKNSCVMIYVYKDGVRVARGSGFACNGYIVTAKHVTDYGDTYLIYTDGVETGTVVKKKDIDTTLDLSVLEANIDLPSVEVGNAYDLQICQKLVSITSPNGFKNSIDECLYNGMSKTGDKYLIDISESEMEHGSSGGAIFDYGGKLVGMVLHGTDQGQFDAQPVNDLKEALDKIK